MRVRDIKRRVVKLLAPQIVRDNWLYSGIQMRRFLGECYPVRREKKRAYLRKLFDGKIGTIYGMTATEIPNDLPNDPEPIEAIPKHELMIIKTDYTIYTLQ